MGFVAGLCLLELLGADAAMEAALCLAGAGQGWGMWFSNPKSCGQGCLRRICSTKGLQDECSSQGSMSADGVGTRKTFGMNTLENTLRLGATVFPTFLTKLILVKWGFSVAATWEVCLFPCPKTSHF